MSDEAMSNEEFEKYDPDDDFAGRRREAIFGDDTEDDEDNKGDEGENNEDGEDKQYTEIELKAEREDLLGRKAYTPESIDSFIDALRDGEDYQKAVDAHLELMADEPDDSDEKVNETTEAQDLSAEFPTMDEEEKSSSEEFPTMTEEELKKKKNVGTGLEDEFPSMDD